jgi:hypothetical protein
MLGLWLFPNRDDVSTRKSPPLCLRTIVNACHYVALRLHLSGTHADDESRCTPSARMLRQ